MSLLDRAGYELVPLWRRKNLDLAAHLHSVFEKFGINCVLDVGANKGQYHDFLRSEVGYKGWILSFEPIKTLAQNLMQRAGKELNWEVHGYALGSTDTELLLNVAAKTEFSSFLELKASQNDLLCRFTRTDRQEVVQVRRLDSLMPGLLAGKGVRNIYLKLDTQGYDLEVIGGAKNTLPAVTALQTEVAVKPIYQRVPSYMESIRHIENVGFDLTGLFAVARDEWLRAIEFDAVMVSRNVINVSLGTY